MLPYVLRPRDLVSRPGNMDETVQHIVARRAHQILRISGRSLFINSRIIRKINDALSVGVKISLTFVKKYNCPYQRKNKIKNHEKNLAPILSLKAVFMCTIHTRVQICTHLCRVHMPINCV